MRPSRPSRAVRILAIGCLGLAACGSRTPDRVADKFIDLYFVETDQANARELCAGLARQKLDDELKLIGDARGRDARNDSRPTVFWQRRDLRLNGERANATYDLTIRYGSDETRKNAMLSLERGDGGWRVGNFQVGDGALPPNRP